MRRCIPRRSSKNSSQQPLYLHHGIASRAFERRFNLADYVKVAKAEEPTAPPFPELSGTTVTAQLDGDRLTITAGDVVIIENAYVSFLPHWYRAARKGVLIAMFGRNLQGMSWEDPSHIQRAAKAGKLVGALMRLNVTPPGRNSQCVCTPRTHQKYKRCCGRPME